MKLNPVGGSIVLFLWAVFAISPPVDAQTKPAEYELIIGEKLHEVALEVPFSIVTPTATIRICQLPPEFIFINSTPKRLPADPFN